MSSVWIITHINQDKIYKPVDGNMVLVHTSIFFVVKQITILFKKLIAVFFKEFYSSPAIFNLNNTVYSIMIYQILFKCNKNGKLILVTQKTVLIVIYIRWCRNVEWPIYKFGWHMSIAHIHVSYVFFNTVAVLNIVNLITHLVYLTGIINQIVVPLILSKCLSSNNLSMEFLLYILLLKGYLVEFYIRSNWLELDIETGCWFVVSSFIYIAILYNIYV